MYVILCASLRTNLPLSLYLRATTTFELNFLETSVDFIKCHPCPLLQPFEGTVSATFIRFQLKCQQLHKAGNFTASLSKSGGKLDRDIVELFMMHPSS